MRSLRLSSILLVLATGLHAQSKQPLDHSAYDGWRTVEDERISADGRWVVYSLVPQRGDAELHVRSTNSNTQFTVPRGRGARFSPDGNVVVFRITPALEAVDLAKREKKKANEMPKDSLGVLHLQTGTVTRVPSLQSFAVPADEGAWLAYRLQKPADEPDSIGGAGTDLVVRNLRTGTESRHEDVTQYTFSDDGRRLAFLADRPGDADDGAYSIHLSSNQVQTLATGKGKYLGITVHNTEQAAFLTTRDNADAEQPAFDLYHWRAGQDRARSIVTAATSGVPNDWWVSEHENPSFSRSGDRLLFGTAPRPAPEVPDDTPEGDRVTLDIWNWRDPLLQPMQLIQLRAERERTYLAVYHLTDDRMVQLGTETIPNVQIGMDGEAHTALGRSNLPYRQQSSWDSPGWNDYYSVDVRTGDEQLIRAGVQGSLDLSPNGTYALWWDNVEQNWFTKHLATGETVDVSGRIPVPLYDEEHDAPSLANSYGDAGWTGGDRELLLYDRYDMWAVDPTGHNAPRIVTDGVGRRDSMQLRYLNMNSDENVIDRDGPILFAAFNYRTKASGFYRDVVSATNRAPQSVLMLDEDVGRPSKAANADVMLLTRQTVAEFPNLWVTDANFANMTKMSDANPQQQNYRWATVESFDWRSVNNEPLQGLLYKPDDFDATRQYPMIVYFYERSSNNLHQHSPPIPHRSTIRPTFYASRGYVVFIPDITYEIGYPGESAMDAVIPGVLELIDQGFVDPNRIGVQGHSWGGYQIAYMVTKTNIFRAAAGGAPVANMTSAYGGIRWGSGSSRMFQYERTQSRIGATLWEAPMRYIENSPLFWADKVATPLLMMHNDHDDAVPWYQGIEMFVALRRLGKPAWLINYNDEPHWPTTYPNIKDWNIRMQQFFDHYLKDAPPPVWLAEGVPAVRKGKDLGLDLVEPDRATAAGSSSGSGSRR